MCLSKCHGIKSCITGGKISFFLAEYERNFNNIYLMDALTFLPSPIMVKSENHNVFKLVVLYKTWRLLIFNLTISIHFQITLESEACEKFLGLLKRTINAFSVLMEVGTLVEFQTVAEEILSYFRYTFNLAGASTVECVQQLLKCLFANNLTSNISTFEVTKSQPVINNTNSFYYNLCQVPYNEVSSCFNLFKNIHKVESDGDNTVMGYLHRKDVSKTPLAARSSDKILASYIRIFEPMVIKSLKVSNNYYS